MSLRLSPSFPLVHEEVRSFARERGEHLVPAVYEVVSAATGFVQVAQFLNVTEQGPFIVCAIKATLVTTPTVKIERDGDPLVQGLEDPAAALPDVGVKSSVSLTSAGDIIPAPIVVRNRLRFTTMRTAGGATADKWLIVGYHVTERFASELQRRGEAFWLVVNQPAAGGAGTPSSLNKWAQLDALRFRLNTPTASRFRLVFGSLELWPLGLTQLATFPTTVDGGAAADIGPISVAPGTRVSFIGTNPSASVTAELAGRMWYAGGQP